MSDEGRGFRLKANFVSKGILDVNEIESVA